MSTYNNSNNIVNNIVKNTEERNNIKMQNNMLNNEINSNVDNNQTSKNQKAFMQLTEKVKITRKSISKVPKAITNNNTNMFTYKNNSNNINLFKIKPKLDNEDNNNIKTNINLPDIKTSKHTNSMSKNNNSNKTNVSQFKNNKTLKNVNINSNAYLLSNFKSFLDIHLKEQINNFYLSSKKLFVSDNYINNFMTTILNSIHNTNYQDNKLSYIITNIKQYSNIKSLDDFKLTTIDKFNISIIKKIIVNEINSLTKIENIFAKIKEDNSTREKVFDLLTNLELLNNKNNSKLNENKIDNINQITDRQLEFNNEYNLSINNKSDINANIDVSEEYKSAFVNYVFLMTSIIENYKILKETYLLDLVNNIYKSSCFDSITQGSIILNMHKEIMYLFNNESCKLFTSCILDNSNNINNTINTNIENITNNICYIIKQSSLERNKITTNFSNTFNNKQHSTYINKVNNRSKITSAASSSINKSNNKSNTVISKTTNKDISYHTESNYTSNKLNNNKTHDKFVKKNNKSNIELKINRLNRANEYSKNVLEKNYNKLINQNIKTNNDSNKNEVNKASSNKHVYLPPVFNQNKSNNKINDILNVKENKLNADTVNNNSNINSCLKKEEEEDLIKQTKTIKKINDNELASEVKSKNNNLDNKHNEANSIISSKKGFKYIRHKVHSTKYNENNNFINNEQEKELLLNNSNANSLAVTDKQNNDLINLINKANQNEINNNNIISNKGININKDSSSLITNNNNTSQSLKLKLEMKLNKNTTNTIKDVNNDNYDNNNNNNYKNNNTISNSLLPNNIINNNNYADSVELIEKTSNLNIAINKNNDNAILSKCNEVTDKNNILLNEENLVNLLNDDNYSNKSNNKQTSIEHISYGFYTGNINDIQNLYEYIKENTSEIQLNSFVNYRNISEYLNTSYNMKVILIYAANDIDKKNDLFEFDNNNNNNNNVNNLHKSIKNINIDCYKYIIGIAILSYKEDTVNNSSNLKIEQILVLNEYIQHKDTAFTSRSTVEYCLYYLIIKKLISFISEYLSFDNIIIDFNYILDLQTNKFSADKWLKSRFEKMLFKWKCIVHDNLNRRIRLLKAGNNDNKLKILNNNNLYCLNYSTLFVANIHSKYDIEEDTIKNKSCLIQEIFCNNNSINNNSGNIIDIQKHDKNLSFNFNKFLFYNILFEICNIKKNFNVLNEYYNKLKNENYKVSINQYQLILYYYYYLYCFIKIIIITNK